MVKGLIDNVADSLEEWIVLPGKTTRQTTPDQIDLTQEICGIFFRFPMMPASMSCLYYGDKHELAIASAREGMPPVIHYNQPIEFQINIIKAVKQAKIEQGEIEWIEDPVRVYPKTTLGDVLSIVEKTGHSVIPVLDKYYKLHGVFKQPFFDIELDPETPVINLPDSIYFKIEQITTAQGAVSDEDAKKTLEDLKEQQQYFPVLDNLGRLVKLGFVQKFPAYFCGASISTHKGWQERAQACIEAGADFINTDTSDAHSDFEIELAKEFKRLYPDIPLILGNIVTAEAFDDLKEYADMIKIGMMTGAGCKTGGVKNVGRPLFEAGREIRDARDAYVKDGGRYIPLIGDGGIDGPPLMTVGVKLFDLMMGGKFYARFFESAGQGYDANGIATYNEELVTQKEYWGEGSNKAKNIERYGYATKKSSIEEGIEGLVPYRGRLKPKVEKDFKTVRETMSNAGCKDLADYRENARLQKLGEKGAEKRNPSADVQVTRG